VAAVSHLIPFKAFWDFGEHIASVSELHPKLKHADVLYKIYEDCTVKEDALIRRMPCTRRKQHALVSAGLKWTGGVFGW
jgi:hypothetical protein